MYPFGSGAPPNSNNNPYPTQPSVPFGAGYPQQPMPGYPSQQSMPNPGYPSQHSMPNPGYPQQSMPTPGYPSQSMPGGYPQQPSMPGFPNQSNSGYPTMPGFPTPNQSNSGYPTMPGFPAPNQSNSGYPTMPGLPPQSSPYPSQPGSGYPSQSGFPAQPSSGMPGYPPQSGSAGSGYPPQSASAAPGYPAASQSFGGYPSYPQNPSNSQSIPSSTNAASPYPNRMESAKNMAACFNEMKKSSHVSHSHSAMSNKGTPTVRPAENFDAVADAKALRKAMKGFGTDEDAIINVLCKRSNQQRQMIAREFKTNFGKDLIEDIKSESSGNFETLLVSLLTPIVTFYCNELHDALACIGTKEEVLIEILCTLSNYEINVIKDAYHQLYRRTLEDDLIGDLSGNFKRIMISLCCGNRDESGVTDPVAAQRDASELLKAGELMVGTDESTFNQILCQRGYPQLKLICEQYKQMTGHSLEKAIEKEFSGDIKNALQAIVACVENKAAYFASRLHKSMAGFGTTDSQLIRVIVTRCEVDLHDIKVAFEKVYGKSLKSWIKGDTSGHYRHCLYALIGEEKS